MALISSSKLKNNKKSDFTTILTTLGKAGMGTVQCIQGRRQGKSLEGAKLPRGSRGQRPLAGVQGLGGGQGAKPPEADTFLVLKS